MQQAGVLDREPLRVMLVTILFRTEDRRGNSRYSRDTAHGASQAWKVNFARRRTRFPSLNIVGQTKTLGHFPLQDGIQLGSIPGERTRQERRYPPIHGDISADLRRFLVLSAFLAVNTSFSH